MHKPDIENAQYGMNKYLLTEKYLLATISSTKGFHSRESIGDVKIERNMNRKKLLIRLTSRALQNALSNISGNVPSVSEICGAIAEQIWTECRRCSG